MKKLLAMVLALVMTLSLAVSANAAAFEDAKDINETYAEAIDVLAGLKVFQGYDNGKTFKPQGDITRAEVAAIVYRIYTGDVADKQASMYATYNKFSDMTGAGWAAGYIGYCANAELVKGYPDGTFKPSGKVTGYEVLAMILRAVGYDKQGEFSGAAWQLHVAEIAQQQGILDDVKGVDLNKAATRELVAELLFEAIQVPMVTYTSAFGYQNVSLSDKGANKLFAKNETLGHKTFKLDSYEGYVTYSKDKKSMILTDEGETDKTNDDVIIKVADQDVFDAGRYGHVWTSDGDAISSVFYDDTLLATKYESWNTDWTTKDKTDFIAKEGDMNYFLNGKKVDADSKDLKAALAVKGAEKALYDIDGDGDIDTVIIINPIVDVMTADYLAKNDKVKIQGKTFDKDEVSGYEDLAKDDVFTYVDMADGVRYFEELEAIAGQKSAYTTTKADKAYITFDGKDYEQSGLTGKSDNAELFTKIKSTFDKDGYVYLDRGGFVAYTSWTKGDAAQYGMVIDAYSVVNDKHDGVEYYANILTTEGKETGYVEVDVDDYNGDIAFKNVITVGKKTCSPAASADYKDLGILVKYTVKDGVYTLTDANSTDDADLSADYKQGAATLKVDNDTLAVDDDSIVFFFWYEETGANKYTVHYGVNVGKYDKDTNEDGIPSYAAGTEVGYLDLDGELVKAAAFEGMTMADYDEYAYIYDYSKTTTTASKLDVYTYYGVNSDGEVIEFSAYKDYNGFNGKDVIGHVVWYLERQDGLAEFGPKDATLFSLTKVGNGNTVKAREEGKNTSWDTYMNADVVYDLTDTSDDKVFAVGKTAPKYDFYWDKTAQALVVWNESDNSDDYVVECAFVVDDTVKYGEFKVDNVKYWYPVETEDGDAIKYSLEDLDSVKYSAAKYHITDKAGKTELIANDAKFAFANDEYTVKEHKAIEYGVKNEVTNVELTAGSDGNYTTTVPYGTDFTQYTAASLVNVYPMTNCEWGSREIVTKNVTAGTELVVVKVTLEGTDTVCKAEFTVTFSWADAEYSVVLTENAGTLTATLSDDAKKDAAKVDFIRLNNGVENIVGSTTDFTDYEDAPTATVTEGGSYFVRVYNAAGNVICTSRVLDVQISA